MTIAEVRRTATTTTTTEVGTWIGAVAQKDIDAATEAAAPTDRVGRVHEAAAKISLGVTTRSTAAEAEAEAEVEVRAVAAVHVIDETEAAVVALVWRSVKGRETTAEVEIKTDIMTYITTETGVAVLNETDAAPTSPGTRGTDRYSTCCKFCCLKY